MTVGADYAVSACSTQPPPSIYKSSCPLIVGLWTGIHPLPRLPASKIKNKTKQKTFLSTNLVSLLTFEQQAARPHFQLQSDCFPQPHTPRKCTRGCQLVKQSLLALKTSRRCGKPKQAEEKKKKRFFPKKSAFNATQLEEQEQYFRTYLYPSSIHP